LIENQIFRKMQGSIKKNVLSLTEGSVVSGFVSAGKDMYSNHCYIATMETREIGLARTGHLQSEHGDVGLLDRRLQRREGCRRARSTPHI
jgi:hypothetical protein